MNEKITFHPTSDYSSDNNLQGRLLLHELQVPNLY